MDASSIGRLKFELEQATYIAIARQPNRPGTYDVLTVCVTNCRVRICIKPDFQVVHIVHPASMARVWPDVIPGVAVTDDGLELRRRKEARPHRERKKEFEIEPDCDTFMLEGQPARQTAGRTDGQLEAPISSLQSVKSWSSDLLFPIYY